MNFFVETAMAQTANNAAAQPSIFETMLPLVGLFFVMYLIIIRPQAKKVKEQQRFLAAMKPGDEVLTASGIIGRIKSITDTFVSLDVGCGNIKVTRESISGPMAQPQPSGKK